MLSVNDQKQPIYQESSGIKQVPYPHYENTEINAYNLSIEDIVLDYFNSAWGIEYHVFCLPCGRCTGGTWYMGYFQVA